MRHLITKLLEPKEHAPEAAFLLAKTLGAKISRTTLEKEIMSHPNYPSFLSISDVLNSHGVENLAAKFDREQILEIPTPFITQVSGKKQVNQFTVVSEVNNARVRYFDPETQQWADKNLAEFAAKTSGVVLMAEVEDAIIEKDYGRKVREEQRAKLSQSSMALALPLLLVCTALFDFNNSGMAAVLPAIFGFLTLSGMVITVLLLWYEVDQNNTVLQDICRAGKKTDCGAILSSKDAKIFGISWSTIGFVYFGGASIALLLTGLTNSAVLTTLAWINLVALPYVFYSVHYQWRVAKQWCVLCLSVQAVLVMQFAVSLVGGWHLLSPVTSLSVTILPLLTAYIIPFIIATLLLPALRKAKQNSSLAMELQRLKQSPDIFYAVLEKQKTIEHDPSGLGITLGNPNAKVKIIKVCNPYCGPCARAHSPMEELLHNNPDLQVQIIFTASDADTDRSSFPVKHLLAVDAKEDKDIIHKALNDWYLADIKDYETFAKKHPMNGELKKQGKKLTAMHDWVNKTEIQFTPTFFVNGYQLPSNYSVNDLKYFLSV